ncbi:MAG: SurA N-terminal domain-containing protein [Anaerolineae bacterium]|jgi:hypothetical protein
MAKRNKKRDKPEEQKRETKKQIARSRKEARQNRIIFASVGAVAAVVIIVAVVGVLQELVLKPSQPVAIVNGTRIPVDDYQNLVNYNRYTQYLTLSNMQQTLEQLQASPEENDFLISFYEQQLGQVQQQLALLPQTTLDQLIDHQLIAEKAEEEGLSVSDAEVEEAVRSDLRQALTPQTTAPLTGTETLPTPEPVTEEQIDELYDNVLSAMGLSADQFETIVGRDLLREKVQDLLASQVVTTGLVAHPQLIQVETQEEAAEALARIEGGEEFSVVAQEVSTDTLTAESGGDPGWVTPDQLTGRYGEAFADAVFTLTLNAPEIVESDGMFYVVEVLERDENGPLPVDVVSQRQNEALQDWLEARKAEPDVEIERLLEPDQIPPDPFAGDLN